MRNRRRRGSTGTASSVASQIMGLSLFIMLLAFFIVLNAISTYEETKARPVMDSINYAFAARVMQENVNQRPSVTQSEDVSVNEGNTLERMKALFTSQIPSHEAVVSQRKGVMHIRLDFADFEAAVLAVGQRENLHQDNDSARFLKGFFLPTLVALMKSGTTGATYRMDMVLNIADDPAALQNEQPQQLSAIMKRLGRMAEKIEATGLDTKLMSIGLQKGMDGKIELLFRPHIPFNPLGTGRELEGDVNERQ